LAVGEPTTTPNRLSLSEDQRDRLLTRLAGGAKNVELATEFGLSRNTSGDSGLAALARLLGGVRNDDAAQCKQEPGIGGAY
jgi:hypothetical protein